MLPGQLELFGDGSYAVSHLVVYNLHIRHHAKAIAYAVLSRPNAADLADGVKNWLDHLVEPT